MAPSVLQGLLDESLDGLLALSADWTIVEANEAAGRIFGSSRAALIGRPLADLVPAEERRSLRLACSQALAGERVDFVLALPSLGDEVGFSLTGLSGAEPARVAVRITVGERVHLLAAAIDPEIHLQRALRRFPTGVMAFDRDLAIVFLNPVARRLLDAPEAAPGGTVPAGDLERIAQQIVRTGLRLRPVEARLGDLELRVTGVPPHEEEPAVLLLENVTAARNHDRVTSEFLRNASHQLRTPIAAIGAAIDALQYGAKDDPRERDRFLDHIAEHVERMGRLTRSLLVLARAQAEERPLSLGFIEIAPLIKRIAAQSRPAQDVELEIACAADVAALADPDLLEEALAALIENAVANTHEGVIRIAASEEDWSVQIDVEDSGTGIPAEHRDQIFEPFYTPLRRDGFGLGLAIARQAVEAMDGRIEISRSGSSGTVMRVSLPSARVVT